MKLLYLDCFAGITCERLAGALYALCEDASFLPDALNRALPGADIAVSSKTVCRGGIDGTLLSLTPRRDCSLKEAFETGEHPALWLPEQAADGALLFLLASVLLLERLCPDMVIASPLHDGSGLDNGVPIPQPAVLAIFARYRIPYRIANLPVCLISPEGAAFAAQFVQEFSVMPSIEISKIAYGAGERELCVPNLLRAVLGEDGEASLDEMLFAQTEKELLPL